MAAVLCARKEKGGRGFIVVGRVQRKIARYCVNVRSQYGRRGGGRRAPLGGQWQAHGWPTEMCARRVSLTSEPTCVTARWSWTTHGPAITAMLSMCVLVYNDNPTWCTMASCVSVCSRRYGAFSSSEQPCLTHFIKKSCNRSALKCI
jgi:hypothetical protein